MVDRQQQSSADKEAMELEFCENYYCTGYVLGDSRGDDEWLAMEDGVLEFRSPQLEAREGEFLVGSEQKIENTRKVRKNHENSTPQPEHHRSSG
jgi:hypothetical protein